MTRYTPATDDPILKHLFQCKMSDRQIAEHFGVSWHTIRRNRQRLGLGTPDNYIAKPEPEPLPPHRPEPTSPVQVAKTTLGGRLTERNGGYVLDGRTPVRTQDMVREANRMRVQRGLPQVGPLEWQVKP